MTASDAAAAKNTHAFAKSSTVVVLRRGVAPATYPKTSSVVNEEASVRSSSPPATKINLLQLITNKR